MTSLARIWLNVLRFLLTRPSRDVTEDLDKRVKTLEISTHTPLAGRDYASNVYTYADADFYSHAPRGT